MNLILTSSSERCFVSLFLPPHKWYDRHSLSFSKILKCVSLSLLLDGNQFFWQKYLFTPESFIPHIQKPDQTREQLCMTDQARPQRTCHLSVISSWEPAADKKPELCFPQSSACAYITCAGPCRPLSLRPISCLFFWMHCFSLETILLTFIRHISLWASWGFTEIRHAHIVNVHDSGVCTKTASVIEFLNTVKGSYSLCPKVFFFFFFYIEPFGSSVWKFTVRSLQWHSLLIWKLRD